LILVDSDSLPHAHAQTTTTYYKHQDSRIKKAQELKTKTSANSDIKDTSSKPSFRGDYWRSFKKMQIVLDTLTLSPCYNAFLITADVPEIYMHQFWFTISKIKDSSTYKFKLDNKTFKIGVEVFREVLQICPRLPNQKFVEPPSHEETVSFIKEIGYKRDLKSITELFTDHMYQPWRTFAAIINRCLSGKTSGLDQLRLSRAQIL
ncbi:hypothetical protein Tco_1120285, partial [Tanacetum coccineum]